MRRGLLWIVLTPVAVTFVSSTYVAIASPPGRYSGRAYADVHTRRSGGAAPEGPPVARGSAAAHGRISPAAVRASRAGDPRDHAGDRRARRRGEGSGTGSHRLPDALPRSRCISLLAAGRGEPHQLLARPRDGLRRPKAHRGLTS